MTAGKRTLKSPPAAGKHGGRQKSARARPIEAAPHPDEQVAILLRAHLRRAMRHRGLSARQTSLQAGQSESLVKQVLAGNIQVPRTSTLNRIADVLGVSERWLIGADVADRAQLAMRYRQAERLRAEADATGGAAREKKLAQANAIDRIDGPYDDLDAPSAVEPAASSAAVPRRLVPAGSDHDLPVYASAAGGAEGQMIMSYDAIEYIRRPEPLLGVEGGFGSYVIGESNAPKYKTGDLALVHGTRTPMPGDWVWIVKQPRENEFEVLVKRLVRRTQREVIVAQLNPPQEFGIPTSQIHHMYQIVGSFERR